jgi:hypothetical protein
MSIELKIKSKHLSEEARIIRFEEHKIKNQVRWERKRQISSDKMKTWHSINQHRRNEVRNENRATFLARAYLKGTPYSTIEGKRSVNKEYKFQTLIVKRLLKIANKYSNNDVTQNDINVWLTT